MCVQQVYLSVVRWPQLRLLCCRGWTLGGHPLDICPTNECASGSLLNSPPSSTPFPFYVTCLWDWPGSYWQTLSLHHLLPKLTCCHARAWFYLCLNFHFHFPLFCFFLHPPVSDVAARDIGRSTGCQWLITPRVTQSKHSSLGSAKKRKNFHY